MSLLHPPSHIGLQGDLQMQNSMFQRMGSHLPLLSADLIAPCCICFHRAGHHLRSACGFCYLHTNQSGQTMLAVSIAKYIIRHTNDWEAQTTKTMTSLQAKYLYPNPY